MLEHTLVQFLLLYVIDIHTYVCCIHTVQATKYHIYTYIIIRTYIYTIPYVYCIHTVHSTSSGKLFQAFLG